MKSTSITFPIVLILVSALLLAAGSFYGLAISPPEEHMGDVQRIMYVHVPAAWTSSQTRGFPGI